MRTILVCLKRVLDHAAPIRVKRDGSGVETAGIRTIINPFDEIALEEALRLKDQGRARDVLIATIGGADQRPHLQAGLAMGADRAVLVETAARPEPLTIAQALRALVEREKPDLVLLGKQAIDEDNAQVGQMLAALWGRPQATFASRLELAESTVRVTREVDAGTEVLDLDLPAVVTAELRLNEPRRVKLPEILKAKSKPLTVVPLVELSPTAAPQFTVTHTAPRAERAKGIRVRDAAELVATLRERGLV
jgi:electron transfer flavoprotein beta subunit